jgi:hypothetical protein
LGLIVVSAVAVESLPMLSGTGDAVAEGTKSEPAAGV